MPVYAKTAQPECVSPDQIVSRLKISDVYIALGGSPTRHGRGIAFWRSGEHHSVALDDGKGVWYDHAAGEGGGFIDLVVRVRGCTRADALRWVADLTGVRLPERSPRERRRAAARWSEAKRLGRQCQLWRAAKIRAFEPAKASADAEEDLVALEFYARTLNLLQNGQPEEIFAAFDEERRRDPEETTRWVERGLRDFTEDLLLAACAIEAIDPECPKSLIRHALDEILAEEGKEGVKDAA